MANLVLENGVEVVMEVSGGLELDMETSQGTEYAMGVGTVIPIKGEDDYEQLRNLPKIDGVTLVGDKSAEDIGISPIGNAAILALFK